MFKYCSFSEYSINNIVNNELCMSHYESFNDPFECRCEIFSGFPKKDTNSSRYKRIINAWGFENVNDQSVIDYYDEYILSLEYSEPNIQKIIDNARISCFSKKEDNLLMWSHYSNGLRGFCIEFDRDILEFNGIENNLIYDVLYERNPLTIDTALIAVLSNQINYHEDAIYEASAQIKVLGKNRKSQVQDYKKSLKKVRLKSNEIYQKMLATKPLEWQYEEEIRVITYAEKKGNDAVFLKYPSECIKSIIIGEKMPKQQRMVLLKLVKGYSHPITLKKAIRVNGKFNVKVEPYF